MENKIIDLGEQKDSIKLIKNSRGYGWEIKITSLLIDEIPDKLREINNQMVQLYGEEME